MVDQADIQSISPLSPQQQGMLLETLAGTESGLHIEQDLHLLHGDLDLPSLERAWDSVVERHSILRTAFVWKDQGQPLQVVLRRVKVVIERHDWRSLAPSAQQERMEAYLAADRDRGFDLARAPLMRFALFALTDDTHQFLWSKHHLLVDGWSWALVLKEVSAFYDAYRQGRELSMEPSRPYRDYVAWLQRQDLGEAERFWQTTLQGFQRPTALGVPEEPAPPVAGGDPYDNQVGRLSAGDMADLQSYTRRHHLTLNIVVQGVWALLLSRYSGQEDVVFGTTLTSRPPELTGVESMVGLFINTLPFRVRVRRDRSVVGWLQELQADHLALRQYEYCSMGQVHQWSEVPGSLPLCESILVFENYPSDSARDRSGLHLATRGARSIGARTKHAVTVLIIPGSELKLRVIYDTRRLDACSIGRILDHFSGAVKSLLADSDQPLGAILEKIPADEVPKVRPLPRQEGADFVAPRGPTEEKVAQIWATALGVERVGIHDNFFELGGHSLVAIRLLSRLQEAFSVELPLRALFEGPTIAQVADRIERLQRRARGSLDDIPIGPASREGMIPLSFAQRRLWFLSQMEPNDSSYNVPKALRITGPLHVAALQQALDAIVARHESLRTTFEAVDGSPVQKVAPSLSVTLPVVDLQGVPPAEREAEARRLASEEAATPFDLARGPLLRTCLLRLGENDHLWLLTMHHIVTDEWSSEVFSREVTELYEAYRGGRPSQLPALPIQYADYAVWQHGWMRGEVLESQLAYWKEQLAGLPEVRLPTDRPRPRVQTFSGARESRDLPDDLARAVKTLSRREGVSLFMMLVGAYEALLFHHTGQDDIVIGSPAANRDRVETQGLIGFFVNTVLLRARLGGDPTFREVLARVREVVLEAHAHQDLPFEKLVAALHPRRDLSRLPLFQVWFVLNAGGARRLQLPGLTVTNVKSSTQKARYDLELVITENAQGLKVSIEYSTALFDAATIDRLLRHYETVLATVAAQPAVRLSALSARLVESDQQQDSIRQRELQAADLQKLNTVRRRTVRR